MFGLLAKALPMLTKAAGSGRLAAFSLGRLSGGGSGDSSERTATPPPNIGEVTEGAR